LGRWIDPQRPDHLQVFEQRVETAGIHHWAAEARRFTGSGENLKIELEREPTNAHDRNAIKVIGVAGGRGSENRYHIGHIPADMARKIVRGGFWPNVFADLRMVDSGDYVHVLFDLCGPKGKKKDYQAA
jgi:hypothetical protein